MKDQYGRIIDYMRISITDRCNLRCRYCMPEGVELVPMKNILSYEEIEMVCQAAAKAGIRKFKITGGEPLVRLGCPELIGKIKKIPGVEQVTMTTNGVLLSKYLPELLKNGLDAVNISLDTLDRERYQVITGRDELFRVLESVDQAVDAGIPVKINSVLQKGMNEDEFLALARLTLEKKLDVRFIEMMPIGLGKKFETIYNEDILEELKKQYPDIQEDRQIHGNGPAVYVKLPGGQGSVGFISALHGKFCQYCNRIRMTAQGCLKPCLCYGKGVELKDIFDRHEKPQRCGTTMADQETLEYLYQAITEAIQLKPKSHRFENLSEITEDKKMSQLGDRAVGKILAICISEKKGTQKKPIESARLVEEWGIEGDAHVGKWHRQVSMLSFEKIEAFREKGADVDFGAFGENLVVEGFDLSKVPVGTKFQIGEAILELTQIGKECHSHCAIYKVMGDCIMPREGVFTRVLKGGEIKAGDEITMLPLEKDRPFTAAVITLSDKGAAGEREDKSGPLIQEMLMKEGYDVIETLLLPDGEQPLKHQLMRLADQRQVNVIFTTGGTGFAERDVTPEATQAVCDRMAMGIADAIRQYSLSITGRAMLSRAVSGIRKKTLIVNLPGSPKAVKESLEYVLPHLGHGLGILRGTDGECGNS